MGKRKWRLISFLVLLLIGSAASCAKPAPAQFEVVSLNITPPEVVAGETATVTAQVKNTGGSEGVYSATLIVDGAEIEKKDITAAPGATEIVTFSLARRKAGSYQVAIGDLTSSLTVKPKLVAKEMELKYDDGEPNTCLSMPAPHLGFLVEFLPLSTSFTINKIRMHGALYALGADLRGKDFELEIWDKDDRILYRSIHPFAKFPAATYLGEFHPEQLTWVEVEIPDVKVNDRFCVHIQPHISNFQGIYLGIDSSVINEHSYVTVRKGETITKEWPLVPSFLKVGDKSKLNWMIRVVGTALVPEE